MVGVYALVTALAAAAILGTVLRWGGGGVRRPSRNGLRIAEGDVGTSLGRRATLVQFSTAFCAPCRATRRVLADVASIVDGVAHIEVDAEANLGLVRRLNVVRTPTVFVVDADGRVVKRASGQPRKADVIAALGEAVP